MSDVRLTGRRPMQGCRCDGLANKPIRLPLGRAQQLFLTTRRPQVEACHVGEMAE